MSIPFAVELIDFRNLTEGLLVTKPIELQNKESMDRGLKYRIAFLLFSLQKSSTYNYNAKKILYSCLYNKCTKLF